MFQQVLTIARNTFTECLRQPVYVVVLLAATLATILNLYLAAYTLSDDNKMLVDMGLSTLFVACLLLAAFSATGVLSEEIENKTVLTVISKPVSRPLFVIGKYVGVAAAIAVAYWILSLNYLLTVRHQVMQTAADHTDWPVVVFGLGALAAAALCATMANYFYHWVFPSTFVGLYAAMITLSYIAVMLIGKEWAFQSPMTDVDPQLMIGLSLVFQAILILVAVAIAASTRLGQVMTLLICAGTFVLGLVSDGLLRDIADNYFVAKAMYVSLPNLQLLWPADRITQNHPFEGSYVLLASGYSALYIGAVLGIAVALFQTREVG
jgi:ABC-type transport system involved in multi-copper enzyme maturation permease subunit